MVEHWGLRRALFSSKDVNTRCWVSEGKMRNIDLLWHSAMQWSVFWTVRKIKHTAPDGCWNATYQVDWITSNQQPQTKSSWIALDSVWHWKMLKLGSQSITCAIAKAAVASDIDPKPQDYHASWLRDCATASTNGCVATPYWLHSGPFCRRFLWKILWCVLLWVKWVVLLTFESPPYREFGHQIVDEDSHWAPHLTVESQNMAKTPWLKSVWGRASPNFIDIYTKTGHGNLLNIGTLPPKKDQKIACSVRLYNFDIFGYSKHQDGGGFHAIPFMSNQETVSFSGAMQSKHGEVLHLATLGWLCSTFYPRPGNCAEGPQGLLGFPTHIDDY